jgi:hypothetical protein
MMSYPVIFILKLFLTQIISIVKPISSWTKLNSLVERGNREQGTGNKKQGTEKSIV